MIIIDVQQFNGLLAMTTPPLQSNQQPLYELISVSVCVVSNKIPNLVEITLPFNYLCHLLFVPLFKVDLQFPFLNYFNESFCIVQLGSLNVRKIGETPVDCCEIEFTHD